MAESSAGTPQIIVSAVVPVYCGAPYLPELVGELKRLRDRWAAEDAPMVLAELILVDDAAIDNSPAVVDRLARDHTWISAIHLARNFGQHPATIAGILHSSGDWVATLDEDLQHPPWQIDDLLREATLTNCDVVYANAEAAVHENLARDLSSDLVKRLVARLSGNPNIRHVSSFRLMRGSIARAASSVCGHETYFDVALSWFTERVGIVRMPLKDQRVIAGGRSNYRLLNLLSHTRRMLMSESDQWSSDRRRGRFGRAYNQLCLRRLHCCFRIALPGKHERARMAFTDRRHYVFWRHPYFHGRRRTRIFERPCRSGARQADFLRSGPYGRRSSGAVFRPDNSMIVLERTGVVAGEPSRQIMALFGAGLIGCSILAGLAGIAKYAQKHFPFSWQNAGERQQHANEIERYIAELAGTEGVPCVVSVIWAAGRAGFLSTSPEILEELSAFRDVLAFADRLGSRLSSARHMFHLTSSAGGLFEGQRLVDQELQTRATTPLR